VIYILNRRGLGRISCSLIAQHSTTGIQVHRNDRTLPPAEMVFRWGTTSSVRNADTEINSSAAIHLGSAKAAFRAKLAGEDLCPKTWFTPDEVTFPCIVRPAVHSQGRNLFVCRTAEELRRATRECGTGWYASELIEKKAEFRIYLAQGRVIGVGEKHPANESAIAWNMAQGGTCKNVRWDLWPLKVVRISLDAFRLSGLDFGAVDIITDRQNKPYVLEINSAPTLANYRGQGFAKVFDYIVENGKATIPLVDQLGGYLKFIHPAVCSEAWL
jgi:glutathione synthase/RimK-type ligase-like ATP-grasp enzyme